MRSIILFVFTICCLFQPSFAAEEPSKPPVTEDYFKELTPQETQSISYIVMTLCTRSAIGLFLYRSKLDKAGEKIDDVNPLRFWKEVLTNPKMRDCLKNIKGIVRRQFIDGFVKSFQDSQKRGTIKEEYIEDFSKTVGIPLEQMQQYVKNQQWDAMLNAFFAFAEKS